MKVYSPRTGIFLARGVDEVDGKAEASEVDCVSVATRPVSLEVNSVAEDSILVINVVMADDIVVVNVSAADISTLLVTVSSDTVLVAMIVSSKEDDVDSNLSSDIEYDKDSGDNSDEGSGTVDADSPVNDELVLVEVVADVDASVDWSADSVVVPGEASCDSDSDGGGDNVIDSEIAVSVVKADVVLEESDDIDARELVSNVDGVPDDAEVDTDERILEAKLVPVKYFVPVNDSIRSHS